MAKTSEARSKAQSGAKKEIHATSTGDKSAPVSAAAQVTEEAATAEEPNTTVKASSSAKPTQTAPNLP